MNKIIKRIIKFIASLLGLSIFFSLAILIAFWYYNSPPDFSYEKVSLQDGISMEASENNKITVRFEIRKGEIARSVGRRLFGSGIIKNEYLWLLLCRYYGDYHNQNLKAGNYLIELPATQMEIYKLLVSGKQILQKVIIPEGFTLKKTAELLEYEGICPAKDFLEAAFDREFINEYRIPGQSMEGYLYPDTYFFHFDYPAKRVVQKMAETFFTRIDEIDEKIKSLPADELNKLVILASIVEREYFLPEEAPEIAGVFLNRLNIGMALQSCATVEYIITEILDRPHPEFLSTRDLDIKDPYNTYNRPGLPPGPICAPGALSLKAAYFPAKNNYLYFRLIDIEEGKHYFSRTLDDHIRAGRLYLKGR